MYALRFALILILIQLRFFSFFLLFFPARDKKDATDAGEEKIEKKRKRKLMCGLSSVAVECSMAGGGTPGRDNYFRKRIFSTELHIAPLILRGW